MNLYKMMMILQTIILAVLSVALFVVLLASAIYNKVFPNIGSLIATFLLLAVAMVLKLYSVNCMVVGNCNIWTWVVTVIMAIVLVVSLIAVIVTFTQGKKLRATLVAQEHALAVMQERLMKKEHFGSSDGGALIQLDARDEQDAYEI